jgi:serine/threonine-protein kinase HipA
LKILVVKNDILIGTLKENDIGIISFDYLQDINTIQYLIGLKDKTNTSNKLFPVFENLLPEHEQLELIKAKYKIKRRIDLLLYLENIHGSFEFYRENEFSKITNRKSESFIYSAVKEDVLDNKYIFPNILSDYELDIPNDKLYPAGLTGSKVMGISGFQYKFSVTKDELLKKISFCNEKNSSYIMKPYNLHYSRFTPKNKDSIYIPYLLINEHIFMTLARDFGFDIPYNAIIRHNEDYHYIIKRYDRYHGLKIDHHEVLTLLNKASAAKYDVSCKDMMDMVLNYLNNDEMLQLFRFIVFSIVIAHGDLHAKNISLIYKSNSINEDNMELAPYYDISTVRIYKDVQKNDIGMAIKNKNKEITLDDLLWLADIAKIDRTTAKEVIKNISYKFIIEFKIYIHRLPQEIKILPVYRKRSIYNYFDTLEKVFNKFYNERCKYIRQYLFTDAPDVNNSIWE